ncbi:hypothetical protein [Flavobacterium gilvum]|uniref:Uncharacterized protein n=1 Tax=Flavobacterium gilvum TaxID=1492737 RepID=A0AAC9I3C3_9FLAO|nr:hypothetical protein [Flavobacterium gilvum]AOW08721.1 hypothetical protein EM308_03965 [Flavobacterium gilvum]KFC59842.1 hypothetical protein FEM08_13530 [Flavobacterium gilvum]
MTKTKVKPNEVIGDNHPILLWQVNRIMKNCHYQVETKNEWVQWVTGDVKRSSLKSITQAQAKKIIMTQEGSTPINEPKAENWGLFDTNNTQHRRIQANLRAANIVVKSEKWGEVADMLGWFDRFLKSDKSPVKKPLKQMTAIEVSKIIRALDGVVIWKNSV